MLEGILISLGFSISLNLLMFVPAFRLQTDKLTDISYALSFIFLAGTFLLISSLELSKIILFLMILAWGLRLGAYLLIRIRKMKRDPRFDGKRENFFKFMKFWLVQGLTVWLIMMSSTLYFNKTTSINYLSYWGLGIFSIGLIIESVADYQKYTFKLKNKSKWIESGLWHYSRHPNYFGEILVWVGVYVFTSSSLNLVESIIALISPAYIIITLLFISGLPPLEKRYDKKYGKLKAYRDYKKRTSVLIPWFTKK